jgi:hypothetical protein
VVAISASNVLERVQFGCAFGIGMMDDTKSVVGHVGVEVDDDVSMVLGTHSRRYTTACELYLYRSQQSSSSGSRLSAKAIMVYRKCQSATTAILVESE